MKHYEAGAHDAQMKMLNTLLMAESCNFTELAKAAGLTGDHADFHIKQLIKNGYVEHKPKSYGEYQLTRAGKEYANRMDTETSTIEKQPKLSVAIVIENENGEFLRQQRLKQPYYGYWANMTGKIRWGETVLEAAARELAEETGLSADLAFAGIYHKMDYNETTQELLEDKFFFIVHATNPRGELIVDGEGYHNEWLSDKALNDKEKCFESVSEITRLAKSSGFETVEKKFYYTPSEY